MGNDLLKHVLCDHEDCDGFYNENGICNTCGRPGTSLGRSEKTKNLFKCLTIFFLLGITGLILLILEGYSVDFSVDSPLSLLDKFIFFIMLFSSVGYLFYLGRLASHYNRSVIMWVGGSFIFSIFGVIFSYILMRGIVKSEDPASKGGLGK
jgi:hypothetical protein